MAGDLDPNHTGHVHNIEKCGGGQGLGSTERLAELRVVLQKAIAQGDRPCIRPSTLLEMINEAEYERDALYAQIRLLGGGK